MELIELIKAAIIGIIQGITEWLPISSTGHMILADEFIQLNVSLEFWEMFLVVVQLGSICAVIVLYFRKLNPFARSKSREQRRKTWMLWAKVVVACIPAAIAGILLDDWFTEHFHNAITVAIALVVYGVAFIVVERIKGPDKPSAIIGKHSLEAVRARTAGVEDAGNAQSALQSMLPKTQHSKRKGSNAVSDVDQLSFGRALGIGAFQVLAIVPGTSRSGSTILGGRILGVSREAAAEFSFFLAIPVMFGWSMLKFVRGFILGDLVPTTTEWGVLAVGVIVAFVVSIFAIRFLMGYIRKHSFEIFGWYRIVLGVVVLIFFAVTGQLLTIQ